MSEALLAAIANLATVEHLLHLALGVMLGLAIGAFPGLGGIAGLVIVGIGLFAFPEITELLRRNRPIASSRMPAADWFEGIRDVFRNWFLCLRCAGLGTLIGAIPGLGGTVVDWIAYGHVVQTARDKSRFGKGDIRGVLAPESANNAKEGGGWIAAKSPGPSCRPATRFRRRGDRRPALRGLEQPEAFAAGADLSVERGGGDVGVVCCAGGGVAGEAGGQSGEC